MGLALLGLVVATSSVVLTLLRSHLRLGHVVDVLLDVCEDGPDHLNDRHEEGPERRGAEVVAQHGQAVAEHAALAPEALLRVEVPVRSEASCNAEALMGLENRQAW